MVRQKKKRHSESFESLQHLHGKEKLAERLRVDWLRVDVEKSLFCWVGPFVPDIAVYDEDGLAGIYEVVVTHDVDLNKMQKIHTYAVDVMRPLFLRTISAENAIAGNDEFMLNIIL